MGNSFDIRTIMVPTDLSECAEAAFAPACRLADLADAEVVLVSVLDRVAYNTDPLRADPQSAINKAQRVCSTALGQVLDAHFKGTRVRARIAWGNPIERIAALARDEAADLVVIGTHGRTGLGRLLVGSVAEAVVRTVSCPVMVVRPRAKLPLEKIRDGLARRVPAGANKGVPADSH